MMIITYIKIFILSLIQGHIIFVPKPTDLKPMKTPLEYGLQDTSDQTLVTEDGITIHYWLKKPVGEHKPYIVFFQGNSGHLGDIGSRDNYDKAEKAYDREYRINFLKVVEKNGYGIIAVSHRGYGISSGKPSETGFVEDVKALSEMIKKENIKVIPFGESLGSFSALTMMSDLKDSENLEGVVLIGAFASIEEKAYELHEDFRRVNALGFLKYRFDNKKIISETDYKGKILLLHGSDDQTTAPYHSEILLGEGRKKGLDIELVILKGAGHITWNPEVVLQNISAKIADK